jgi:hypothetical protein
LLLFLRGNTATFPKGLFMFLELSGFFGVLFLMACTYVALESAVKERKSEQRFRAMESSLGRGRRMTVTVATGGQFPVRMELGGVVYGFRHDRQLTDFITASFLEGESVSAERFGGVLLSHPSLRGLID